MKMSKKIKTTSLLDYFSLQAKKRKENGFEDSSANTSLKADSTNNCVLLPQPTNNSEKAETQKDANVFRAAAEEVGQLLAKHHGKFACTLPIGFIHALTSAK